MRGARAWWIAPALAASMTHSVVARAEWDTRAQGELGGQGAMFLRSHEVSRRRLYAAADLKADWSSDTASSRLSLRASARAWWDLRSDAEVRALSIAYSGERVAATLGFQEIAWGETFGLPIADVVNPRDLRDPLFFEMDWMRKPVACANLQYLGDSLRLQAIVTPVPRVTDPPQRHSGFDPLPPALDGVRLLPQRSYPLGRAGRDAEYGGRAGYLFDFGLDASLFYYRHWSRTPVVELGFDGPEPVLVPIVERVESFGLTFSQAFEDWVLRGDVVLRPREPWSGDALGPHRRIRRIQSVVGADVTTQDDWTLGGQVHYEQRATDNLFWLSARARKGLFDGRLEPQVFVYEGVGNTDLWLEPRVDWSVADAWTISARADFLWGDGSSRAGDLAPYSERHRVFVASWVRF